MSIPFTVEQFLDVFSAYNNSVWPLQIGFVLLALLTVYFTVQRRNRSNQIISLGLAFLWIWMGVVYHLLYFTAINKAAYAFGVLNIIQGCVFLYYGFVKSSLSFRFRPDVYGVAGAILIFYALLIYPILGYFLGHVYPQSPTFGLPCPTTIFTFGMLLLTDNRIPIPILIIPFLWSLIGSTAAVKLGILEDTGLLAAGLVAASLLATRNHAMRKTGLH